MNAQQIQATGRNRYGQTAGRNKYGYGSAMGHLSEITGSIEKEEGGEEATEEEEGGKQATTPSTGKPAGRSLSSCNAASVLHGSGNNNRAMAAWTCGSQFSAKFMDLFQGGKWYNCNIL